MKHARLTGTLQLLDSRSSQRTYEFNGSEPYPHKTNITVLAQPDQSTDDFIAATDTIEGEEMTIDAMVTAVGDIITGVPHVRAIDDLGVRPGISDIHTLAIAHRLD